MRVPGSGERRMKNHEAMSVSVGLASVKKKGRPRAAGAMGPWGPLSPEGPMGMGPLDP